MALLVRVDLLVWLTLMAGKGWRLAGGYFRPRLVPTFFALCMFIVCGALGDWQIKRLHWKESLIATIDQRTHETPVDVSFFSGIDADYRPATAAGDFQNDHNFYVLAVSHTGEGGYHVLTPLRLNDNRILLVDRGWIPYDHKPNETYSHPLGHLQIGGILRVPEHHLLQSSDHPDLNEWEAVDLVRMGAIAHFSFLPYVLEMNDASNVGGYPVGGQTRITLPNNHFGYALTWFGLGLILMIIFLLSSWRKGAAN